MNTPESENSVKQCCAQLYESDLAKYLLGDSFHPGGLALTRRLGELLHLGLQDKVLDVACGKGTSAGYVAEHFGCVVVGVDYGEGNVNQANRLAEEKQLARFRCERADAEKLPFPDSSFDAVICECAFCTFPDKSAAAREFARVVRPGGSVGLGDLTRAVALPRELDGLLAHITCIADAQPIERYQTYLSEAGFVPSATEAHNEALEEMVQQIRGKLLAAEIMIGLKTLELPGVDFAAAKQMATRAREAIGQGQLGYALIAAIKL
jgi:ubiquinone/menaquinone biosynthesis C-methylase UbiE